MCCSLFQKPLMSPTNSLLKNNLNKRMFCNLIFFVEAASPLTVRYHNAVQEGSFSKSGNKQYKGTFIAYNNSVRKDNLPISHPPVAKQESPPPLVSALKASAEQNVASFHFPGHNRGLAAPSSLTQLIGSRPFSSRFAWASRTRQPLFSRGANFRCTETSSQTIRIIRDMVSCWRYHLWNSCSNNGYLFSWRISNSSS